MPPTFRADGSTRQERNRRYDRTRDAGDARKLYDGQWRKASKAHLSAHPLCSYCDLDGRVAAATLVDHFWPHRGDVALFWRREFWVSSCDDCHSGMKQGVERAGNMALRVLSARLGIDPLGGV